MRGRAAGRAYVVNLDRNLLLRLLVQPFLDGGLGAQGDHVFDLPPTPRASGCCVRALITGPATYLVRLADLLLAEQLLPHLLFGGRHRAALEGRAPAHCQLQVLGLPLLWDAHRSSSSCMMLLPERSIMMEGGFKTFAAAAFGQNSQTKKTAFGWPKP